MTVDQFAKNLKTAREARNLSLDQLGNKARMFGEVVEKFEMGLRVPDLFRLIALCRALKMSPNDLLGYVPPKEKE